MTTETQPEQPKEAGARTASHHMAYKTVLAAVVIGILTITVLWVFVIRQEEIPANTTVITEPDIQVKKVTEVKAPKIDRRLVALSGRIDRGFKLQQTHSADVKRNLTVMAESLQSIKEAIADLGESNRELGRRISEATSQLDSLVKNVRALKVVKRKPAAKHKPRPVKTPPFQLDAIDVWDDVTYVAVSQAGRAAFLKTGERQSGWTVTRIDRLKGQVDFQGPAGQVHSVSLQR